MVNNLKFKDWETVKLEDILDYIQPSKYIVKSTDYNDSFKTPVLTPGKSFILGYTNENDAIFEDLPVIIFDDFTTSSKFVNFPFKVKSSAMKILKPSKRWVNLKYIYYYMQTVQIQSDTHKRYWISIYSKLNIKLPPLPEQHAIVERIEELFSELDNGIENLKQAQQQLKTYRQSVLKWAFEGNFKYKSLSDVCLKIQDGSHFSPQNQMADPGPNRFLYLTSKNIRNNGLKLDKVTYVDDSFHNSIFHRCNPEFGDVLLTKDGANTGNVCLNTIEEPFSLLSSVCLIKPNKEVIIPKFIMYYIQGPKGFKELTGKMSGTAIKRIILRKIKVAKIPVPPLEFQAHLVREIDDKMDRIELLKDTILINLQKAESLRQSILKMAFDGRLTEKWRKENVIF